MHNILKCVKPHNLPLAYIKNLFLYESDSLQLAVSRFGISSVKFCFTMSHDVEIVAYFS